MVIFFNAENIGSCLPLFCTFILKNLVFLLVFMDYKISIETNFKMIFAFFIFLFFLCHPAIPSFLLKLFGSLSLHTRLQLSISSAALNQLIALRDFKFSLSESGFLLWFLTWVYVESQ